MPVTQATKDAIQVWTDRKFGAGFADVEEFNIEIRLTLKDPNKQFQVVNGAVKINNNQFHWLQFIKREVFKGKVLNQGNDVVDSSKDANVYIPLNTWVVDHKKPDSPYYEDGYNFQVTATTFSILDNPIFPLNNQFQGEGFKLKNRFKAFGITVIKDQFQTFLLEDKRPVFEVEWVSEWTYNMNTKIYDRQYLGIKGINQNLAFPVKGKIPGRTFIPIENGKENPAKKNDVIFDPTNLP